jgi:hypothetical protein
MKRPRPVYVYVEKKRLPKAKKSSSGEGAPRSRSNTPVGSSGQEKRKVAKTKSDEPTKKSSLRVFSSNAFGEIITRRAKIAGRATGRVVVDTARVRILKDVEAERGPQGKTQNGKTTIDIRMITIY